MKIDCSKTVNYLKERGRMCRDIPDCNNCPISSDNNKMSTNCNILPSKYPEKAIEIVQKWSDEHPQKTRLEDFLEKYPNADKEEVLVLCVSALGYQPIIGCNCAGCEACWNMPV